MSGRLEFAIDAVYKAGRSTLAHFGTGAAVEHKADDSPITIADRTAERILREMIGARFPGEAILGEEEGATGEGASRWVIDPIDGTKSFVCGVPLYATLLSWEEEGEPEVGICYFPALDEMLYASRGEGAWWNGRRAWVSPKTTLERAVVCSGGHRSMHEHGFMSAFLRVAERTMATRTWSDAYGHALVATGRVEAMLDPAVERWDVSPMKLIVEEAGGRMTTFAGADSLKPVAHGKLQALSSNGLVHEELLEALRQ